VPVDIQQFVIEDAKGSLVAHDAIKDFVLDCHNSVIKTSARIHLYSLVLGHVDYDEKQK